MARLRSRIGAKIEPCGPLAPLPPAFGPESLLWQSVQYMMLLTVHGVIRLGTLDAFRPARSTGWKLRFATEN